MLTPRKAVESAEGFLRNVYLNQELSGLRIEEIEKTEDGKHWLVTLSFLTKAESDTSSLPPPVAAMFESNRDRVYKLLRVAADGDVRSMRIGPLQ